MTQPSKNNSTSLLSRNDIIEGIILPYVLKIINDNGNEPLYAQELTSIIQEKTCKKDLNGVIAFEGYVLRRGFIYFCLQILERDGLIHGIYKNCDEPIINRKTPCYWQITSEGREKLNDIIDDYRHPFMETLYYITQISKDLFE